MKPNGRRAWRKAAKKLRRTMGRRWRSQEEWVHGKRWSELFGDLTTKGRPRTEKQNARRFRRAPVKKKIVIWFFV